MLSLERQNALRAQYRRIKPTWQPATEIFADLVRVNLAGDSRLLDLGCGRGGLVEQLDHPLSLVAGIDPDMASLLEHRLDLPRAAGFCEHLPFVDNAFDLIYASWLLEHLPRPELTFQAIARVLKPEGVFVFITPNGRHPLARLNQLFGRFARIQGIVVKRLYGRSASDAFPTYYCANTADTLTRLCRQSGLSLVTLQTISDPTYLAFTPALFRFACWFETRLPERWRLHLVGVIERKPGQD